MASTSPVLIPADPADAARWEHTRVRRRMLDGHWEQDISQRLNERLTPGRSYNLGRPVQSLNLFASTVRQLAVQYDAAPTVHHPDLDEAQQDRWKHLMAEAHLWSIMQRASESVIGLRECFMQVEWVAIPYHPEGGEVVVSPLTPDTVVTVTRPGDPDDVLVLKAARCYTVDGDSIPAWAVWDISNPDQPHFRVEDASGRDITVRVVRDPQPWPYLKEGGQPYLPFVKYRAQDTADPWDAYALSELVHAALDTAILWTAWGKCVLDASWSQRWVIDLMLQGMSISGSGAAVTGSVETDPTSILAFTSRGDKPGSVGQYNTPVDPAAMALSIVTFQASVLSNIGIHPADLEAGHTAQSGVAIQLKRSAQRRLALRMLPQFRQGDVELLGLMASISNTFGETSYPTEGWELTYHLPEASVDEFIAELDRDERMVRLGFISKVDLMQKYRPELSREQAREALLEVAQDNASFPLDGPAVVATDALADPATPTPTVQPTE